ncbi:MAG: formylmethanofuran dehydrogenase subunit E family protein, partial [Acidobacteriota bacterium]|nr:formylmethanofuran dehydrogenase subunit E family protein [Acidobacteriota bacterium]
MKTFDEYVALAEQAHGHICAGQILGLRMAIYGVELLGIEDPAGRDRKRLVTFVEIDRCATDAIPVVTGCRLGKRALKFRDFGKVAATFCDIESDRAVRVSAKESSKRRARELYPEIVNKNQQQMLAYREMPQAELFDTQWVRVVLQPEDFPGYKGERK